MWLYFFAYLLLKSSVNAGGQHGSHCLTKPIPNTSRTPDVPKIDIGQTITYQCVAGYAPTGAVTLTCINDNGKASLNGQPPVCKNQCFVPAVSGATTSPNSPKILIGSSVTYSCLGGRQLVGTATLNCVASGDGPVLSGNPPQCQAPFDANDFCGKCTVERKNQKDFYQDPSDCQAYFHCIRRTDGTWSAARVQCATGLYFREDILQCVPLFKGTCSDPCADPAVQNIGTHADADNCNQYYICSNYVSVKLCCPIGESWQQSDRMCEEDDTCPAAAHDLCRGPAAPAAPTEAPPSIVNDVCLDMYGVRRKAVPNDPASYYIILGANKLIYQPCAPGTLFSLALCKCSEFVPYTAGPQDDLLLKVRFADYQVVDESSNQFLIYCFRTADLFSLQGSDVSMQDASFSNHWVGNFVPPQHCEVPGIKTNDIGNQISLMFWFKVDCANGGGIISNRGDPSSGTQTTERSLEISYQLNNLITYFKSQQGDVTLLSTLPATSCNQYTHYALVYDGSLLTVYVNAVQVAQSTAGQLGGRFFWIAHCPLVFGHDTLDGHMQGFLSNLYAFKQVKAADFIKQHMLFQLTI